MLRGPQTLGELRTRADRMHPFDDLAQVESVIEHLPELITKLPRRSGEKEARYATCFRARPLFRKTNRNLRSQCARIESRLWKAEVTELRSELESLNSSLPSPKQFE